jgi:hypothetical protein
MYADSIDKFVKYSARKALAIGYRESQCSSEGTRSFT